MKCLSHTHTHVGAEQSESPERSQNVNIAFQIVLVTDFFIYMSFNVSDD